MRGTFVSWPGVGPYLVFYLLIGITSAALQTASYPFSAAPYLAKMKIMKGTIAIEILGNRVKPLLSLKSPGRVVYRLTTSDDNQRMGKIRLLLLRGDKKLLIKELIVRDIPEMKAGDPDIALQVARFLKARGFTPEQAPEVEGFGGKRPITKNRD